MNLGARRVERINAKGAQQNRQRRTEETFGLLFLNEKIGGENAEQE